MKDAHGNLVLATETRKLKPNQVKEEEDDREHADGQEDAESDGGEDELDEVKDGEEDENDEDEVESEADMDVVKEYDEDEDDQPEKTTKKVRKGQDLVTELKKYQSRQEMVEQAKIKIASYCTRILEDPEENVNQIPVLELIVMLTSLNFIPKQVKLLKDLIEMCFENDAVVQKLAVLSLLEVFKDIIPGYLTMNTSVWRL